MGIPAKPELKFSYDATGNTFTALQNDPIDLTDQFDVTAARILGDADRTIFATIKTTWTESDNTQYICGYGLWGTHHNCFGIRIRNGAFGGGDVGVTDKYTLGLLGYSNDFYSNFQITANVETTIAVSYNLSLIHI